MSKLREDSANVEAAQAVASFTGLVGLVTGAWANVVAERVMNTAPDSSAGEAGYYGIQKSDPGSENADNLEEENLNIDYYALSATSKVPIELSSIQARELASSYGVPNIPDFEVSVENRDIIEHQNAWAEIWLILKFILVIALSAFHMRLARHVRVFAADANSHTQRYFRIINEVPTLIMIAVVILVIVKPF